MTVQDAIAKRKKLQDQVLQLVRDFEAETLLQVSDIKLVRLATLGDPQLCSHVMAEVQLPDTFANG